MVSHLDCHSEDNVWEPCGGSGDLVDGVLRVCPQARLHISEIDQASASKLASKYSSQLNIAVKCEDALLLETGSFLTNCGKFTRIIANPPYGAWQTPKRRQDLKKRFPGLYVRDTYGVFLAHSLNQLEHGGRLVFIIPDTFLWLNRHEPLRYKLLTESTIEEIALFPSNFFPGVSFGYSGLAIITLVKDTPKKGSSIRIVDNISDVTVLRQLTQGESHPSQLDVSTTSQKKILRSPHSTFPRPSTVRDIILNSRPYRELGEIADVKTGFYSGNDRNWLRRWNSSVPRSKGYDDVQKRQIANSGNECAPSLDGLDGVRHYIPIVRGGAAPFVKQTKWYVDWSKEAVSEYKRPGRNPARFQNSNYYFRQGIGVPMVASSRLTGALLNRRVFDQSVVGLFPYDGRMLLYLLGFLNTEIATVLLRQINGTANNSANYLKRLPIVLPSETELNEARQLVAKAIDEIEKSDTLSVSTRQEIEEFYRNLWCGT